MQTTESQTGLYAEGAVIKQAMEGYCHLNQLEALAEVLEHLRGELATLPGGHRVAILPLFDRRHALTEFGQTSTSPIPPLFVYTQ